MHTKALGTAAAAVAATLSFASLVPFASPASAATVSFKDKAGDVRHGGDLRSVTVANKPRNVWVTVHTKDLVADPASGIGGAVFLDTDGDQRPDFVAVGGFFDGTDYALLRTDSWKVRRATERVTCSYRMRLDYQADTAAFRLGRGCFRAAPGTGEVRVEVRTSNSPTTGHPAQVDWLGTPRTFTRAVAQG